MPHSQIDNTPSHAMTSAAPITIHINGTPREIPAGTSVAGLLDLLQKNPRFLAVERNQELVPRTTHTNCQLQAGDQIEIVTLVGGG